MDNIFYCNPTFTFLLLYLPRENLIHRNICTFHLIFIELFMPSFISSLFPFSIIFFIYNGPSESECFRFISTETTIDTGNPITLLDSINFLLCIFARNEQNIAWRIRKSLHERRQSTFFHTHNTLRCCHCYNVLPTATAWLCSCSMFGLHKRSRSINEY